MIDKLEIERTASAARRRAPALSPCAGYAGREGRADDAVRAHRRRDGGRWRQAHVCSAEQGGIARDSHA